MGFHEVLHAGEKTWMHGGLQLERKLTVAIVGECHACVTEFAAALTRVLHRLCCLCFFSGVAVCFVPDSSSLAVQKVT